MVDSNAGAGESLNGADKGVGIEDALLRVPERCSLVTSAGPKARHTLKVHRQRCMEGMRAYNFIVIRYND